MSEVQANASQGNGVDQVEVQQAPAQVVVQQAPPQVQQPEDLRTFDVGGLPCFNTKDDPNTLSPRWKKWKRAFMLYLTSKGVVSDSQKVALLLHTGGMDFQDVYYTLVGENDQKTFDQCIAILDEYFVPQANTSF